LALLADLRNFLIRAIREHEDEWLAIEAESLLKRIAQEMPRRHQIISYFYIAWDVATPSSGLIRWGSCWDEARRSSGAAGVEEGT